MTHSWSNHGLWQQQHPTSTPATPTRIEMRVHYATPSSPPTTPPTGMPPRPPRPSATTETNIRHERQRSLQENSMNIDGLDNPDEESVSDRINRRSYYHR